MDPIIAEPPAPVLAPLQGTVVSVEVAEGSAVRAGSVVALVESMKLHHEVVAPVAGLVTAVTVEPGATVRPGDVLLVIAPATTVDGPLDEAVPGAGRGPLGLDRPDLTEVLDRHRLGLDAARPAAVARRRAAGRRTARENLEDLIDDGTWVEYGPLVIAAQARRRTHEDLVANTPADGMVGGIGSVNGAIFPDRRAKTVVVSYDYMVLAGTQGHRNHLKKDRLFELAERLRLPVVVYAEGGGGRPGDTDTGVVAGLNCLAFLWFARLSGTVPLVGIAAGYCFAGNAALLGCCDVVIATEDANIGMGGPAMIEGGGLGVHAPTEVGPISVQRSNGVVDLVARDEAHATELAQRYLAYFQGRAPTWTCADQTALRDVVPVDRLRSYDVRAAVDLLADEGSVLELRSEFGVGMITALARIEGRAVGIIANNPSHLAGAIDSDGADKAARFLQLCDAHGLPIVTLVDTPGMMVGPDVEETALVRHCARLFVAGANISVPMVSVVLRKSYGLGAQAMMGGSTRAPLACVSWPSGEFGGMGLEGAVRLGYRKELDACESDEERDALFRELVDRLYEVGKAVRFAEVFEIDDVIDPADTRRWITSLLDAAPERPVGSVVRSNVDTW
ncbi:MAG: carboxyl transferase domain-containing protein [Ilumatobacteraceae bacterium]